MNILLKGVCIYSYILRNQVHICTVLESTVLPACKGKFLFLAGLLIGVAVVQKNALYMYCLFWRIWIKNSSRLARLLRILLFAVVQNNALYVAFILA
jgi:hypothetical protein